MREKNHSIVSALLISYKSPVVACIEAGHQGSNATIRPGTSAAPVCIHSKLFARNSQQTKLPRKRVPIVCGMGTKSRKKNFFLPSKT